MTHNETNRNNILTCTDKSPNKNKEYLGAQINIIKLSNGALAR